MVSLGTRTTHRFFIVGDQSIFASSDVLSDRAQFSYNKTVYACSHIFFILKELYISFCMGGGKSVERTGGKISIHVELVGQ